MSEPLQSQFLEITGEMSHEFADIEARYDKLKANVATGVNYFAKKVSEDATDFSRTFVVAKAVLVSRVKACDVPNSRSWLLSHPVWQDEHCGTVTYRADSGREIIEAQTIFAVNLIDPPYKPGGETNHANTTPGDPTHYKLEIPADPAIPIRLEGKMLKEIHTAQEQHLAMGNLLTTLALAEYQKA